MGQGFQKTGCKGTLFFETNKGMMIFFLKKNAMRYNMLIINVLNANGQSTLLALSKGWEFRKGRKDNF
jgi:hypothetical protein